MATKPKQPSLTDIAAQQVNTALAPVIAALNQQKTQATSAADDRAAFLKQLFEGVAQSQQPVAGQIEQTYGNAADRQAMFAKGYSDAMRQATGQAADQSNALLQQNGSPQTVTDKGQAASDVLYGLGGYNPASVLNTSGAAFASAAKLLPGQARLQGGMYAASALSQGAKDAQAVQNQIMQTEAQRPGLLQSALSGLQDTQFKKQQAAFDRWLAKQQLAVTQQNANKPDFFGSAEGGYYSYDPATGKIKNVIAGTGPSPQAPHLFQGANGAEWAYDPNTGSVTQLTPGAQKPKFTPSQIAAFKADAAEMARKTFWGVRDDKGKLVADPLGYQAAMSELLQHGIPLAVAQNALNRYWKRPGYEVDVQSRIDANGDQTKIVYDRATKGGGRPVRPFQERQGKAGAAAETAASQKALAVVTLTKEALGTPYVWGGESPSGFDCSGLLQYVWAKQGVQIPRTTYDQWTAGRPVDKSQLQPGDAVFFVGSDPKWGKPGHVGMYIGNGQFIEAPKRGTTVRVSYLKGRRDYVGARRYA